MRLGRSAIVGELIVKANPHDPKVFTPLINDR
jgi:hypothetical protein